MTEQTMWAVKRQDGDGGVDRMFDSEWLAVVSHDNRYFGYSTEDAVEKAVKMTEERMARHLRERTATLERERDELAEQLATAITDAHDAREDERSELARLQELAADVLGAVAAAGVSTPLEGYANLPGRAKEDIAAIVRERDEARRENGNLSIRMAQCVLHRDEARELARKLLPLAEDRIDDLRVESRKAMTDSRRKRIERALADADKTIAAAPEWLRCEP